MCYLHRKCASCEHKLVYSFTIVICYNIEYKLFIKQSCNSVYNELLYVLLCIF